MVVVAAAVLGSPAVAGDQSLDAWLRKAMTIGTDDGLDGLRITYRRLPNGDVPSADEIGAIRERVAGRPDHPDREVLERMERQVAGKAYHEAVLWRWKREWRYNLTWPANVGDGLTFMDRAWSAEGSWRLNPDHLELVPFDERHEAASDHRMTVGGYEADLSSLLNGGLGIVKAMARGLVLSPEVLAGSDRWRASGTQPPLGGLEGQDRWTLEGTWYPARGPSGAGTIDRSRFERTDGRGRVTVWEQVQTGDWRPLPGTDLWIAGEANHTGSMPEMRRSIRLVDVARFSAEEFRAIVAIPKADGTDPVRGASSYSSIVDLRGDEARKVDRSAGMPLILPPEPYRSGEQRERRLLIGGWVLAGAILSALVFLRIRRTGLAKA